MRGVFGVVGLVVSLAVVGVLSKKQLAGAMPVVPSLQVPGAAPVPAPTGSLRGPSQELQHQHKQAQPSALPHARPPPADQ